MHFVTVQGPSSDLVGRGPNCSLPRAPESLRAIFCPHDWSCMLSWLVKLVWHMLICAHHLFSGCHFTFSLILLIYFYLFFFETNVGLPLGAWAQLGWAIFTLSCMYEMQIFWVVWASFRKSFAFTLLQMYANISKRFRLFSMRFTADFNIVFIINYKSVFVIMLTNTHLFCDLYVCMRICSSNNLTLYFMIYFKKF